MRRFLHQKFEISCGGIRGFGQSTAVSAASVSYSLQQERVEKSLGIEGNVRIDVLFSVQAKKTICKVSCDRFVLFPIFSILIYLQTWGYPPYTKTANTNWCWPKRLYTIVFAFINSILLILLKFFSYIFLQTICYFFISALFIAFLNLYKPCFKHIIFFFIQEISLMA